MTDVAEHLDSIVTVSVTAEMLGVIDDPPGWPEGERMRWHYQAIAIIRARLLDMELSEGPAHRWLAGDQVFYSWPLRPIGSGLNQREGLGW